MSLLLQMMELPEEFYTDSPVHISKLSDEEFKKRMDSLNEELEEKSKYILLDNWSMERTCEYWDVIDTRATYSLPVPAPINVFTFTQKDLLAIFGKMHSRSFARSMRLCKDVNKLLAKNLTKFSIRIRGMALKIADLNRLGSSTELSVLNRMERWIGWTPVENPSFILPFTFTEIVHRVDVLNGNEYDTWTEAWMYNGWDGTSFRELFEQMKWPLLRRAIRSSSLPQRKSWMIGLDCLTIGSVDVTTLQDTWEFVKCLKPRKLEYQGNFNVTSELLDLAGCVSMSQPLQNFKLSSLVKKWKSGSWRHKATLISGFSDESKEDVDSELRDCFAYNLMNRRLVFVPNPDNVYLVLITNCRHKNDTEFKMILNIQLVSDLIAYEVDYLSEYPGKYHPIDYSAYRGDLDSLIDPRTFCDLFANRRSEK